MSKCIIEGCDRKSKYKSSGVCQTHYHRMWRTGSYDDPKIKGRYEDSRGYQYIYMPGHVLTPRKRKHIAEHRFVLYEKLNGVDSFNCELCNAKLNWNNCHADHIDENTRNNSPENIRALCMRCNVWRSMPPAHERIKNANVIEYKGRIMTAHEWSRESDVFVSSVTIMRRIRSGMDVELALFGEKKTHNGRPKTDSRKRKTRFAYERKNSIAITIGNETKTAAEWSKTEGAKYCDSAIRNRVRRGIDHREAVFG